MIVPAGNRTEGDVSCPAAGMMSESMRLTLDRDHLVFADRLRVSFHRTLRVPDDGRRFPLPPGLGRFPIARAGDHEPRLPAEWRGDNVYLIPMYQREALWIGLENEWPPVAVRVAVGHISVVSGRRVAEGPGADPQDYVVTPEQLWLDGINVGPSTVRQFVAMPLGQGYTVESAITGTEQHGGIQITVWPPRPEVQLSPPARPTGPMAARRPGPPAMGLGAGGRVVQKIYPDPHGVETWDTARAVRADVHILNSAQWREVVGLEPPPTPVDAATYSAHGLPWFALYEEHQGDVPAPEVLRTATTIADTDRARHRVEVDGPVDVDEAQIIKLRRQ